MDKSLGDSILSTKETESDPARLAERANDPEGSFLDTYRSLSIKHRDQDEDIVCSIVEQNLVPRHVRYMILKSGPIRGAVEMINGDKYLFLKSGELFKLGKAQDGDQEREVTNFISNGTVGCDLNGVSKAGSGFPVPTSEPEEVQQQPHLASEAHPGAAGFAGTPDLPTRGKDWHGDQKSLGDHTSALKSLAKSLQYKAPVLTPEQSFMVKSLGYAEDDVRLGKARMSAREQEQYRHHVLKSLRERVSNLETWAKRRT